MSYRLLKGDVIRFVAHYRGPKFHATLSDPPYELAFMNRKWDASGISFRSETWAALSELLHPGAFGMTFASARGWHRLAVAIEDAGLIIHPSIFGWAFGSGFPKATRIDTQIDKAEGVEGEPGDYLPNMANRVYGRGMGGGVTTKPYSSATPVGRIWSGHRYGLQALKPALEPIIVFQKPYQGKPVDSITRTGAGALWIDGARIDAGKDYEDAGWGPRYGSSSMPHMGGHQTRPYVQEAINDNRPVKDSKPGTGRWPANFCVDEEAARRLDEQSGELGLSQGGRAGHTAAYQGGYRQEYYGNMKPGFGDEGGASRFFFNVGWHYEVAEQIAQSDPVMYTAKASRRERDAGLSEITPQKRDPSRHAGQPSMNDGEGNPYNRGVIPVKNNHPTIKAISLCKWLATLLLPPTEYAPRRLLVPFAGTGSEMIGSMLAGWDEIVGVEREAEYIALGEARLAWWADLLRWGHTDIDTMLRQWNVEDDVEDTDGGWQQTEMFK